MNAAVNVPELRFSEFSGEWVEKKLGVLASVKTGSRDTQNRVEDGLYPFYVRSNTVERINSYAFDGEAILTSGDGVGVGKNYHYINDKFDFHQRVYSIHNFNKNVFGKYIFYLFSERFYRRVSKLSAKNSVDSIRMNMITDMLLPITSLTEQQKIAQFLTSVDTKIEQLTQKKTLLEQYKKGVSQKLFSQEIRFKADDGSEYPDWVEKKLGDVLDVIDGDRGNNYPKSHEFYDKDYCLFLSAKNITKNGFSLVEKQFISKEKDSLLRKGKLHKLDVVLTTRGSVGHFAYYNDEIPYENIRINSGMVLLRNNGNNIKQEFVYRICKSFIIKKQIKIVAFGSAQPQLTVKEINKFKLSIPSLPEQEKIANFLSSIDTKIEQTTKQLNQTKQFKKALLQQMFV